MVRISEQQVRKLLRFCCGIGKGFPYPISGLLDCYKQYYQYVLAFFSEIKCWHPGGYDADCKFQVKKLLFGRGVGACPLKLSGVIAYGFVSAPEKSILP